MKNPALSKCLLAGLLASVALCGCRRDSSEIPPPPSTNLNIAKAKEIFNQTQTLTKLNTYSGEKYVFSEAGLNPTWDDAKYAENGKIATFNMPVFENRGDILIGSVDEHGQYKEIIIPMMQKIVVNKNIANDSSSVLVLTLVPAVDYYQKNPNYYEEFVYGAKSKGSYTGHVFYEDMAGRPIAIHYYKEGKLRGYAKRSKQVTIGPNKPATKVMIGNHLLAFPVVVTGYMPRPNYGTWDMMQSDRNEKYDQLQERVDCIAPPEGGGPAGEKGEEQKIQEVLVKIIADTRVILRENCLGKFLESKVGGSMIAVLDDKDTDYPAEFRASNPKNIYFRSDYLGFGEIGQSTLLVHEYFHAYQHLEGKPTITKAEVEFEAHLYQMLFNISKGYTIKYDANMEKFEKDVKSRFNPNGGKKLIEKDYAELYTNHIETFKEYTKDNAVSKNYSPTNIQKALLEGGCF